MDSNAPQIIFIKTAERRQTLAGILVDNGYTVRTVKVRHKGSRVVTYGLEYYRQIEGEKANG